MNSCVNCAHAWVDKLEFRGKVHRALRCGNENAGQRKDYAVAVGRGADAVFVEREAPKWCPEKEGKTDNPSVTASPCHLPLHTSHGRLWDVGDAVPYKGKRRERERMMGFSESDIRRMAPWAQEQVAVQMVRQKRGRTSNPSVTASPCHLPLHTGGFEECGGNGKYHAKKAVRLMPNGEEHVFDSQKEARRYDELAMLAAVGAIRDLRLQVQFTLQESYISAEGNRVRAIRYVADFQYFDCVAGEIVVEDVKSKATKTRVYEVKKKLMAERYGVAIREV